MTAIRLQDTGTTITDNWACFVTETRKEILDIWTSVLTNTFCNIIHNPCTQTCSMCIQSSSPFAVAPSLQYLVLMKLVLLFYSSGGLPQNWLKFMVTDLQIHLSLILFSVVLQTHCMLWLLWTTSVSHPLRLQHDMGQTLTYIMSSRHQHTKA